MSNENSRFSVRFTKDTHFRVCDNKEDTHARTPANNRSIYRTGNALAKGFAPDLQQTAGAIFTATVSERGGCADHGLSLRDVFGTPAGLYQLLFQHHGDQAGVFPDRKRRVSTAAALCAHRASAGLRHRAPARAAAPGGAAALCVLRHQRHGKSTEPIPRRGILWRKQSLSGAIDAVLLRRRCLCALAAVARPALAGSRVPARRLPCEPAGCAQPLHARSVRVLHKAPRAGPRALPLHNRQRGLLRKLYRHGVRGLAGLLSPRQIGARKSL